ncbi:hypothetical protein CKM354_001163800 [Cercospora kikuchii]|uniref:Uncharacterized protein n=1 Tax=Cercospora kikuchii TaxID=84275 RepID=A0A9P3FL42_9PEZI|nr:uncharacterized protein CKM354_001163800 [Cercospora kikuchii]GIZ48584.1 hypothetical protein CKM354_001163800 [Cercospora kikuchii]
MSFEDEVQQATIAIEGLARTQLRNRFPYMKIEALEESLAETANVLVSMLVKQKKEICAAESRTSFMSLSAELRNAIYEMALKVEGAVNVSHQAVVCDYTTLLLANRQVYEEARPIWYGVNTFNLHVGFPRFWPLPQEPDTEFHSPRTVSKWVETLGSRAAMVKSVRLEVWGSETPGTTLLEIFSFAGQGLQFSGLTVHQGVLKCAGLLDGGVSPEVFKFSFRDGPEVAEDLYKAAGVSGEDILTAQLIKRLG